MRAVFLYNISGTKKEDFEFHNNSNGKRENMEKYLVLATFAGSVIALIFAFVTGKKVLSFDEGTTLMSKISRNLSVRAPTPT